MARDERFLVCQPHSCNIVWTVKLPFGDTFVWVQKIPLTHGSKSVKLSSPDEAVGFPRSRKAR